MGEKIDRWPDVSEQGDWMRWKIAVANDDTTLGFREWLEVNPRA